MSSDHRRQSIVASKKRRPSIHLERRGTIRRDSKLPVSHTPTEGMFGRKREDSISTDADGAHPELDKTSAVLTEQKEDALAGIEGRNEQTSDSVTGQRDTAVTTEQGPPAARVNTLFPDQQTLDNAQAQPKGGGDSSSKVLQQEKGDDNRSSKKLQGGEVGDDRGPKIADASSRSMMVIPEEASHVFDADFLTKSKWSTLKNFVYSLQPHKGGGCSHVMKEVRNIAEGSGTMTSEDQVKEQVTVMAQHAIDSKLIMLIML